MTTPTPDDTAALIAEANAWTKQFGLERDTLIPRLVAALERETARADEATKWLNDRDDGAEALYEQIDELRQRAESAEQRADAAETLLADYARHSIACNSSEVCICGFDERVAPLMIERDARLTD
jgi:hypothetical protein